MPGFPFPGRPGGEHDEPLLDMIIARRVLPPDAPQPMHDLARMLAALAEPAEPGTLAGEVAVRAAFSRAASPASISPAARQPGDRRRMRRPRRVRRPLYSRMRLATGLTVAAAALGVVLAAYLGVLPNSIKNLVGTASTTSAPSSSAPGQPGPLGHGKHLRSRTPVASAPASHLTPGPRPSGRSAPSPAAGIFITPTYKPAAAGSPGSTAAGPACSPNPWPSATARSTPSAHPSPSSSSHGPSLPVHCTGIPTGPSSKPTLVPYAPLAGADGPDR